MPPTIYIDQEHVLTLNLTTCTPNNLSNLQLNPSIYKHIYMRGEDILAYMPCDLASGLIM